MTTGTAAAPEPELPRAALSSISAATSGGRNQAGSIPSTLPDSWATVITRSQILRKDMGRHRIAHAVSSRTVRCMEHTATGWPASETTWNVSGAGAFLRGGTGKGRWFEFSQ